MPADLNDYFNKRGNKDNNDGGGGGFNFEPPSFLKDFGAKSIIFYILIAIIVILVVTRPLITVKSGEVGVQVTLGKYDERPLQPGLHFFMPFVQEVFLVDTRVRIINYSSTEDTGDTIARGSGIIRKNSIRVLDARGLDVYIDLTVQYKLNENQVPQTIANYGLSWEDKIINPVVREIVRSVVGQYAAEELPTKRNEIAALIEENIRKAINEQPLQPVELATVQLREIILPQKIKDQIERVQIAKQEAQRTKYEVERANQEALKKVALAEGTAKAAIVEAKGKADAAKIEADASAYANIEISKSLTKNLLDLRQIEVQGKFNEALRTNKDAKIFLTPGGAVPNIWIDTKDKQQNSMISQ